MTIRTVTGDIEAASVSGAVLGHEHLVLDLTTPTDQSAAIRDADAVAEELRRARTDHGLELVVDLTCRGMGRDVGLAASIADRAGVRLVASTGYYYERFHPVGEVGTDPGAVEAGILCEIETGLDGTGIRPGVLGEIGSSEEISPAERASLLGAGRAAQQAGLSVATHAHLSRRADEQLELLTSTGLEPHRVCLGHQDLSSEPGQLLALARTGAYLGLDTVGKASYQSDDTRRRLLLALLEAGHERSVILSGDVSRDSYLEAHGGSGYGYVLGPFRESLRQAGVPDAQLDLLYRDNALRWLEGA